MLGVGSVIGGRFRVDQILGSGGMGVVVAATHLELGHRVAIKLLRDEMAESPVIVERFLREARAVVGLRTEHVCRVTDVGRLDTGAPYIVMEMLEGVDLQRTVARSPLPFTTAVEYVLQACVALAEAHAAGIIHRDLKPANLFVTRRLDGGPLVKVLDFGIAKALTETGAHLTHQSAMGSPGYMSPEQIQSARDVDLRTDIWALGVTLYQLLSARLPFGGTNITEIAIAVATEPPAPLDVDPRLRAVIWKCLEKQAANRYANLGELMAALAPFGGPTARSHLGHAAQLAGPSSGFLPAAPPMVSMTAATQGGATTGQAVAVPSPTATPRKRNAVWIGLVLLVAVGGAAGVWIAFHHSTRVAVVTPDAARVVAAVPVVAVVDAAPPIDAAPAAAVHGDPWAVEDQPPIVDAGVTPIVDAGAATPRSVKRPAGGVWSSIAQTTYMMSDAQWRKQCPPMLHGPGASMIPLGMRMHCACLMKDQKLAEQLLNAVDADERPGVRAHCKQYGIALP
ncbi:MAG: serine/threonine-protein kinase [Kofleriaceae bacterium]